MVNQAGYLEAGERGLANVYGEVAGGFTNEDPDLLRLIYSCETVGGRNYSRYCSPEFDRLAKQAYMTPFGERRIGLYHQMQKLLHDDAVAVPFIGDNVHIGLRASVRDLWMNSLGLYPVFVDTWLDR
jgi:dipeptide transport system substrate-binding protein